jgi:hypothetical protein
LRVAFVLSISLIFMVYFLSQNVNLSPRPYVALARDSLFDTDCHSHFTNNRP